jgi:hypothetical protein
MNVTEINRLAELIEAFSVSIGHDMYNLTDQERAFVVEALRDRARAETGESQRPQCSATNS